MKIITKVLILLFSISIISCENIFMEPKPGTDNLSIFNEYAELCITKFGLEEAKGIDLEALADSIRPFVTPNLSEQELFDLMSIFVDRMKEGHTSLSSIDYKYNKTYYWFNDYPLAMDYNIPPKSYYGDVANPEVQIINPEDSYFDILYGFLPQDNEIGYISIITFDMTVSDSQLETMMAYLKDAKGLIIDVRNNFGGYMDLVGRLSSYFFDSELVIGTNYIKNGPGKDDFAESIMKISPSGSPYTYTKPVIVLQDRVAYSSASLFCIVMNAVDNATTMGQKFGGGTGEIMDGFLANGWQWTLSTSNFVDLNGMPTDLGIDPDIYQIINPSDTIIDAVIERAIVELQ